MPNPPSSPLVTATTAPEEAGFVPSRLRRISDLLRADSAAAAIPGAVALIFRRGALAYFDAFVAGTALLTPAVSRPEFAFSPRSPSGP